MRSKLEALLAGGQDSASLRFALANACFGEGDMQGAILHAGFAVRQQPDYSAAWRLLGQAQVAAGQTTDAALSFERGIEVAEQAGDRQVGKEMQVFLRRLKNQAGS